MSQLEKPKCSSSFLMLPLRRAPALVKGATIAFVAPASGLAALVPHRLTKAREELERLGFRVKIYPSVTRTTQENTNSQKHTYDDAVAALDQATCSAYSSADAETRGDDLMQAFLDLEVTTIVCTIGGFTSHEILEYLDFSAIAEHPKIFCGFSDITTLHLALYTKTQLCSFYGPALSSSLESSVNHWHTQSRLSGGRCSFRWIHWTR